MNRYLFAPALFSIAGLLSGADTAMAQGHSRSVHSSPGAHASHTSPGAHASHTSHSPSPHPGSSHGSSHGSYHQGGVHHGSLYLGSYPNYRYYSPNYSYYDPIYDDSYPSYGTTSSYYVQPVDTSANIRV